jgi:hypothetical protein
MSITNFVWCLGLWERVADKVSESIRTESMIIIGVQDRLHAVQVTSNGLKKKSDIG